MKRFFFWMICLALVLAASFGAYRFRSKWGQPANGHCKTAPIGRGDVKLIVRSSGTIQPVQSVQVGSFVSGPIQKVFVDFNSRVTAGQILAQIDPRTYKANVAREEAGLAYRQAEVERAKVLLEQAGRDEQRALKLRAAKKTFISETEVDKYIADRKSLDAQLKVAEASVRESAASLASAQTNLDFTDIKSPVDGIVVDRKVDSGQTVASQFQTPVLFLVSPDLEKQIYVYASVDEADIGHIREAEKRGEPVFFTVDAYPADTFKGKIAQVRLNPTTVQNVVTYTVVVRSPNTELKLLPGMTANLAFQVEKHTNVLRVPNSALRFRPKPEQVCLEDRHLVETPAGGAAAAQEAKTRAVPGDDPPDQNQNKKRIWVLDGELLCAKEVVIGLADSNYTEIVSGDVREGQEVATATTVSVPTSGGPP
jgi:HlyD family secretion protein